jgi:AraC family transcriptional regulator
MLPCIKGKKMKTSKSYIRRLRIQKAASRLKNTNESITEIAFDSWYESVEDFIRVFKKFYRFSPMPYRKLSKNGNALPKITSPYKIKEFKMNVVIKKLPKMKVAYIRHVGPYSECSETWEQLTNWAAPKGLLTPKTIMLGICHDDPGVTESSKIRYDACIVIDNSIQAQEEVGIKEIESQTYGMTEHIGPYEKVGETYAAMCGSWTAKNKKEILSLPAIEIYINDPKTTPKEKLITEIYMPILEQ